MKFECSVKELEVAVNHAMRAIPPKGNGTVMEQVMITANDAGVEVVGSDGNFSIIEHVDASIADGGAVLLNARLLYDLLRSMPSTTITFDMKEKSQVLIKGQGLRHTLTGMDASEYPDVGDFNINGGTMVQLPQARLATMISHVMFAVASDDTRQTLNGCLLELENGEMRVVCLDGFRLALQVYHGDIDVPGGKRLAAIVPGKIMSEISRLLGGNPEDISTFQIGGGHMSVTVGKTRIMCTLLAGEFINYRQILPKEWQTRITVQRAELLGACERAGIIAAPGRNSLIRMRTEEKELIITSNSEFGQAFEEVPCVVDGKAGEIAMNSRYIAEVLKNIEEDVCTLQLTDAISPCVVAPTDGDQYLYLVLPIRVSK